MFKRSIIDILPGWKNRSTRKPLVLRGARQVGKTSAVHMFAREEFANYIHLNLEQAENAALFTRMIPIRTLIQTLQLKFNRKLTPGNTLIFIDEIQHSSVAMNQLRYFYEEMPDLHVIAAGSLLEVKIKKEGFSFPVGRVEYRYMHPVAFDEFLMALQENEVLDYLNSVTLDTAVPGYIHEQLLKRFQDYLLVGGMPEAVALYAETGSFIDLDPVYESLLTGFRDDVAKYASEAKAKYIQYIIEHAPGYIGLPVKYEKFGESNFRSREMREAFDVLEKAMIIHRVRASASRQLPLASNLRKSSKLLYLDVGMVNYRLGMRPGIMAASDINAVYHGQVSEQIAGQTLLALNTAKSANLHYWYREQKGAISEVDFLIAAHGTLIPIEVKSGKTGTLKSLHNFMDESQAGLAVRVYSGELKMEQITTARGKTYTLLSLPFYLLYRIEQLTAGAV